MAKSAKNIYRVTDIAEQNVDPLAFRLLCFGTRYRSEMEFSWDALEGQNRRLADLRRKMEDWAAGTEERSEAATHSTSGSEPPSPTISTCPERSSC